MAYPSTIAKVDTGLCGLSSPHNMVSVSGILVVFCGLSLGGWLTAVSAQDEDTAKAVAEMKTRITRIKEGYETLRDERKRLIERAKKIQDDWQQAQGELATIGAIVDGIQAQIGLVFDQMAPLTSQVRKLDHPNDWIDYKARKQQYNSLNRYNKNLNGQVDSLTKEVQHMQQLSGPVSRRLMSLLADLAKLNASYESLETRRVKEISEYWPFADVLGRRSPAELEEADAMFSDCIKTDLNNVGAFLARGGICWRLGRFDAAQRDLERVIESGSPETGVALALRGLVLYSAGNMRGGLQEFGLASKESPNDPRIHLLRALVHCGEERYGNAVAELQKGLKFRGADPEIHCLLAWIHCVTPSDKFSPTKAEEHAQRACTLTRSQDWLALASLAASQTALNDFTTAKETMSKAKQFAIGDCRECCQEYRERCEAKEPIRMDWRKLLRIKPK